LPDVVFSRDKHHGVEDLWPESVKPNPQQPIGGEEPRLPGTLPAKDGHLMSQGDEFKFQRAAATNPEREQEPRADRSVSMPMTV